MSDTAANNEMTANGTAAPEAAPATVEGPITLSSDDSLTMKAAQQAIYDAQARLGAAREQYMQEELAHLQGIQKARQSFEGVIRTLAEKHGVDLTSGQWMFNMGTMTFSKRPAR